jgi:hypothetical protein
VSFPPPRRRHLSYLGDLWGKSFNFLCLYASFSAVRAPLKPFPSFPLVQYRAWLQWSEDPSAESLTSLYCHYCLSATASRASPRVLSPGHDKRLCSDDILEWCSALGDDGYPLRCQLELRYAIPISFKSPTPIASIAKCSTPVLLLWLKGLRAFKVSVTPRHKGTPSHPRSLACGVGKLIRTYLLIIVRCFRIYWYAF